MPVMKSQLVSTAYKWAKNFFNKQVEMNMQNNYFKYNVSLTTARQLGMCLL